MAETVPSTGRNTTLEVREGPSGSDAWFKLSHVTALTPPSDTVDEHEVTHLESEAKEFIAGLSDPGEMSATINYEAGSETDLFILAWKASGEKRDTRITYASGREQVVQTFVKTYVPNEITNNAPQTAALGLRNSGASTWS